MKMLTVIILIVAIGLLFFIKKDSFQKMTVTETSPQTIRYVAIGDSYTIGEGVSEQDRWPNVLTKHLQEKGVAIELVANPSRTGWTTKDAITKELPVFEAADADFVTVLLGVNDWVQGVTAPEFRSSFSQLLDSVQAKLPNKQNIAIVTIPDFSATPTGPSYANGRDISAGIAEFNSIIKEEATKRQIKVADIYELSQSFKGQDDMVVRDGLHPSAKAYLEWEKVIYPEVLQTLNQSKFTSSAP